MKVFSDYHILKLLAFWNVFILCLPMYGMKAVALQPKAVDEVSCPEHALHVKAALDEESRPKGKLIQVESTDDEITYSYTISESFPAPCSLTIGLKSQAARISVEIADWYTLLNDALHKEWHMLKKIAEPSMTFEKPFFDTEGVYHQKIVIKEFGELITDELKRCLSFMCYGFPWRYKPDAFRDSFGDLLYPFYTENPVRVRALYAGEDPLKNLDKLHQLSQNGGFPQEVCEEIFDLIKPLLGYTLSEIVDDENLVTQVLYAIEILYILVRTNENAYPITLMVAKRALLHHARRPNVQLNATETLRFLISKSFGREEICTFVQNNYVEQHFATRLLEKLIDYGYTKAYPYALRLGLNEFRADLLLALYKKNIGCEEIKAEVNRRHQEIITDPYLFEREDLDHEIFDLLVEKI